jgi:hypothetical protein
MNTYAPYKKHPRITQTDISMAAELALPVAAEAWEKEGRKPLYRRLSINAGISHAERQMERPFGPSARPAIYLRIEEML